MIQIDTWLGQQQSSTADNQLCLPIDSRIKSRLKVTLKDGQSAGLFLPRGHILRDGDFLKSCCGLLIEVKAAKEKVSRVISNDPLLLAKACYHLGNRHVPLQVERDWISYQHDHVLDQMVQGLGLKVEVISAPFEPEDGAYKNLTPGHSHSHSHSH